MNKIKQIFLIAYKDPRRLINLLSKRIYKNKEDYSYRYSTDNEIVLLQKYARKVKYGIVEIGTLDGGTIREVALCAKVPIFSIDPIIPDSMDNNLIGTREKILKNMSFYKKFTFIQDYSFNVVKSFRDRFDMIWIDGDHTYEGCKKDFEDWYPLLETNGFLMFHDSAPVKSKGDSHMGYAGPIKLVNELKQYSKLKFLECVDSITVFKKEK
jgi:hypothetical protein